eukprot:TRINITY_DN6782_c0_g1_i2.p1 TRINITY_DN6782_c0_g1~~TRINITY_DN6782_c0_g1_i2.p1  ORF type:complete len:607 (+),score=140.57 TRINITY_DN6782_c0_g1_i2:218-1822(+)
MRFFVFEEANPNYEELLAAHACDPADLEEPSHGGGGGGGGGHHKSSSSTTCSSFTLEIDSISELAGGSRLTPQGHSFNTMANQDFAVIPNFANATYQHLAATLFTFSSVLQAPSKNVAAGTVSLKLVLFNEEGNIYTGNHTAFDLFDSEHRFHDATGQHTTCYAPQREADPAAETFGDCVHVYPGTIKLEFSIEDWLYCGNNFDNTRSEVCRAGRSTTRGDELQLALKFKTPTVGSVNHTSADSFVLSLGESQILFAQHFVGNGESRSDLKIEVDSTGNKHLISFTFPRLKSIFYDPAVALPGVTKFVAEETTHHGGGGTRDLTNGEIAGIVVAAVVGALLLVFVAVFLTRKTKQNFSVHPITSDHGSTQMQTRGVETFSQAPSQSQYRSPPTETSSPSMSPAIATLAQNPLALDIVSLSHYVAHFIGQHIQKSNLTGIMLDETPLPEISTALGISVVRAISNQQSEQVTRQALREMTTQQLGDFIGNVAFQQVHALGLDGPALSRMERAEVERQFGLGFAHHIQKYRNAVSFA